MVDIDITIFDSNIEFEFEKLEKLNNHFPFQFQNIEPNIKIDKIRKSHNYINNIIINKKIRLQIKVVSFINQ